MRSHLLDGALLWFDPRRGLNVRFDGPATRKIRRRAPRTLLFGITNRCNLACEFCSRDRAAASAWDQESAHAALVEFAAAGVLEVAFGGGEPLAFRGFDRLLERLREDTPLALHVTTNGALLTPERADRLAPLLGELRLSIYEGAPWAAAIVRAVRGGAQVGANVLCTPARLDGLPALLRRLTDLGVRDVALLRYVGEDPTLHLGAGGEARLAAAIHASPLPVRVSTCFGDRLHVPLLLGGACGAGSEFLTITSDRRLRACSFHEASIPFTSVDEALSIYRASQARLAGPAGRPGCARPGPPIAALADGVRIWRGFGGNNSGDCVLVGRFDDDARAAAFMAELLPGFAAGQPISPAWRALLSAEGIDPSAGYSPDTMTSLGPVVMMHSDMALHDDFVPLRALLWRRRGRAFLGGTIHHHGLGLVAGLRPARDPAEGPALLERAGLVPFGRHGDVTFGSAMIGGPAGAPSSVATRSEALREVAAQSGARVAAEVAAWPPAGAAGPHALARVGDDQTHPEWLWTRFSDRADAEAFARDLAPDLSQAPVQVGATVLAGLGRVSPRLGWLAARRGGSPLVLQGRRLQITVQIGDGTGDARDAGARFITLLRAFVPGVALEIDRRALEGSLGASVRLRLVTDAPLAVLAAVEPAVQAAGVALGAHHVAAADPLPGVLTRLAGDLRRGRR